MPQGGVITIKIDVRTKEEVIQQFPSASFDQYVRLSVTDSGTGMDELTKKRMFDPFFTTKELGKGTGLGLSVVYGVMQSHYGFINVESEVGKGTSFHLYLPVPQGIKKGKSVLDEKGTGIQRGTETVLFVEDEELLREAVASTLESHGYTIHVAQDGQQAIEVYERYQKEIDLVISDMGLPKKTGEELFLHLRQVNPKLKIILASGFIPLDQKTELLKAGASEFIQKPYELTEVLKKIREVFSEG
jgi:two-component system, cell cycle sensor histidine kinase and response regulator CckA